MNIWDIVIIALLAAAVALAFLYIRRHGGGCDGGCDGCAFRDDCGKHGTGRE